MHTHNRHFTEWVSNLIRPSRFGGEGSLLCFKLQTVNALHGNSTGRGERSYVGEECILYQEALPIIHK